MTGQGARISHEKDAAFAEGLRDFFAYRDLGIAEATGGAAVAHVIRATGASEKAQAWHSHATQFQLVYVLKGWVDFEYEGQGRVRLKAGSSVYQPPNIRHRELGHSEDLEMLEVVTPGKFATTEDQ
jgi:quercetin dioxygenase-like cupin family protein